MLCVQLPFRSHRLEAIINEGGLGEMNGCKVTVLAKVQAHRSSSGASHMCIHMCTCQMAILSPCCDGSHWGCLCV